MIVIVSPLVRDGYLQQWVLTPKSQLKSGVDTVKVICGPTGANSLKSEFQIYVNFNFEITEHALAIIQSRIR